MQVIGAIVLIAIIAFGMLVWQGDAKIKLPSSDEMQNAIHVVAKSGEQGGAFANLKTKLSPETMMADIKSWVLKDGIKLPAGWTIKEKTLANGSVITVLVPEVPKNDDDYIAYKIPVSLIRELPASAVCGEGEETVTCAVGGNVETYRVFDILMYAQEKL